MKLGLYLWLIFASLFLGWYGLYLFLGLYILCGVLHYSVDRYTEYRRKKKDEIERYQP